MRQHLIVCTERYGRGTVWRAHIGHPTQLDTVLLFAALHFFSCHGNASGQIMMWTIQEEISQHSGYLWMSLRFSPLILSPSFLSYLILSYLILTYLIYSFLIYSFLILSCLALPCLLFSLFSLFSLSPPPHSLLTVPVHVSSLPRQLFLGSQHWSPNLLCSLDVHLSLEREGIDKKTRRDEDEMRWDKERGERRDYSEEIRGEEKEEMKEKKMSRGGSRVVYVVLPSFKRRLSARDG